MQQGNGAGWHGWPDEFRHPQTLTRCAPSPRSSANWSLSTAGCNGSPTASSPRRRARGACAQDCASASIVDLAVGVAPDGSATWSDRGLVIPSARIGAPPDYFNANGQDWGLAPLSPAGLVARNFEPYRDALDAVVHHAGALRIDHAMSLFRLFWIAEGFGAADGVYVRYPFHAMLRTLAAVSQARHTIIIGEDLGVVPEGFRAGDAEERDPELSRLLLRKDRATNSTCRRKHYPREALACVSDPRSPHARRLVERTRHRACARRSACIAETEFPKRERASRAPAPAGAGAAGGEGADASGNGAGAAQPRGRRRKPCRRASRSPSTG